MADSARPIYIDCEGSGHPPNILLGQPVCKMCGCRVFVDLQGNADQHARADILQLARRGLLRMSEPTNL